MPSHDLASTELTRISPEELKTYEPDVLLDRWKKDLGFDYPMELGRVLQTLCKRTNKKFKDVDKAEILIKAATVVRAFQKQDSKGRISPDVRVQVVTVNPTSRNG